MSEANDPALPTTPRAAPVTFVTRLQTIAGWVLVGLLAFGLYSCVRDEMRRSKHNIINRISGYPQGSTATAKADALSFYGQVKGIMQPCDDARVELMTAVYGSDPVTTYETAESVRTKCAKADVSDKIEELTIPRSLGYNEALEIGRSSYSCSLSSSLAVIWAEAVESAVKGSGDIAKLAESRKELANVAGLRTECDSKFIQAAAPLGVTAADI